MAREPRKLRVGDITRMPPFPFTKLPTVVPGWSCVEVLLCDHSGFGAPHEPALTPTQLKARLLELATDHPEYGYGVVGIGDFQLRLGVFTKGKNSDG